MKYPTTPPNSPPTTAARNLIDVMPRRGLALRFSGDPFAGRPLERRVGQRENHSTIWSARSSSACGILTPSAFAVLRLIANSNFVGCSTGSSAGFAPLRILST